MTADAAAIYNLLPDMIKSTRQNRKDILDKCIEPCYAEMARIHCDYMKFFLELHASIGPQIKLEDLQCVLGRLKEHRSEIDDVKAKCIAIAEVLSHDERYPDKVQGFFKTCLDYFNAGLKENHAVDLSELRKLEVDGTIIMRTVGLLERVYYLLSLAECPRQSKEDADLVVRNVGLIIKDIVRGIDRVWSDLNRAYAKACVSL